jgi:hypothetical protein
MTMYIYAGNQLRLDVGLAELVCAANVAANKVPSFSCFWNGWGRRATKYIKAGG